MFKLLFRKFFKSLFLKFNLNITALTNYKELKDFYKRLKPKNNYFNLIRLGELGDGGYYVPDFIKKFNYCFSFGVGKLVGFENDLAKKFNIKCYLFDASINEVPIKNKNFFFFRKFIAGGGLIAKKKNYLLVKKFFSQIKKFKKNILKIDIEGGGI